MKHLNLLAFLLSLTLVPPSVINQNVPVDTIFAKAGTCMLRIKDQYRACMDTQNARLIRDSKNTGPIYTNAALTDSVNRIGCCAYWEFVDCVQEVADEHCPGERRDVIAYVRQVGSAVPPEDCLEQYPKDSPVCSGTSKTYYLLTSLWILLLSILYNNES